jgi:hypothetical protein
MAEPWQPIAVAGLGLIYPLAVLFVLRRHAVREYFKPAA